MHWRLGDLRQREQAKVTYRRIRANQIGEIYDTIVRIHEEMSSRVGYRTCEEWHAGRLEVNFAEA